MDPVRATAPMIKLLLHKISADELAYLETSRRCRWFIFMRAFVAMTLLMVGVGKPLVLQHIAAPSMVFLASGILLAILDVAFFMHYRRAGRRRSLQRRNRSLTRNLHMQIMGDTFLLAWLCYECGGIESPLAYFFLFHTTLSCLFFGQLESFLHTMLCVVLVVGLEAGMILGWLPPRHFVISGPLQVHTPIAFSIYYLAGISALYLGSWYMMFNITNDLQTQEKQLQAVNLERPEEASSPHRGDRPVRVGA